ncbi:MAG: hypothetical protein ACJ751_19380 [Niastella sp.]|uniref:hypothetical protein n=1 Tax=Niastella sp. TaxID=1869183 RepID=UPI00389B02AB
MKLFYLPLFLIFFACREQTNMKKQCDVRCDVRLFTKYFSMHINSDGKTYVVKGTGSYYTDSLIVKSADTSNVFKLDSTQAFFEALNKIRTNPVFNENRSTGTAQRGEVYYKQVKVFDDYAWDPAFWDLFRPIMGQLPSEFNPFNVENY